MWRYRKVFAVICMVALLFGGVNYNLAVAEAVAVAAPVLVAGMLLVGLGLVFPDSQSISEGAMWLEDQMRRSGHDLAWAYDAAVSAGSNAVEIGNTIWESARALVQGRYVAGANTGTGEMIREPLSFGVDVHSGAWVYPGTDVGFTLLEEDTNWTVRSCRWDGEGNVFLNGYSLGPMAYVRVVLVGEYLFWHPYLADGTLSYSDLIVFGGSGEPVAYKWSQSSTATVTGIATVIDNPAHDLPRTEGTPRKVGLPVLPTTLDNLLGKTWTDVNQSEGAGDPPVDPPVEGTYTEVVNALLGLPAALSGFFSNVVSAVQALPGTLEGIFTGIKDAVIAVPVAMATQLQVLFVPQSNVEYRVEQLQWTFQSKQRMVGLPLPGDVPPGGGVEAPVWRFYNNFTSEYIVLVDWAMYQDMVDSFKRILGGMMVVVTGIWAIRVWRPGTTID